jgi:hypothetical protein
MNISGCFRTVSIFYAAVCMSSSICLSTCGGSCRISYCLSSSADGFPFLDLCQWSLYRFYSTHNCSAAMRLVNIGDVLLCL